MDKGLQDCYFGIRAVFPEKPAHEAIAAARTAIAFTCTCIPCGDCAGGTGWVSFTGEYLGHRWDDLDELGTCETCGGSGLEEMCDTCREIEDREEWKEFQAAQND